MSRDPIAGARAPTADIDGERLWRRHVEMARLGATAKGGVNRPALGEKDIEAHALLATWARERGFGVAIDDIGNMFVRRPGTAGDVAPVVSGSHSDTQPTGGRFDGIFGVLAAFEALEAVDEAGIETKRPLEAAIWNNEEGSRFVPGTMGSGVYAGRLALADTLAAADREGATVEDAVAALKRAVPDAQARALGAPIAAFVETHIEQGPVLEDAGEVIGVVTGIQGSRKFQIEVRGEEAHAGTTARRHRKDAFVEAVAMVNALHEIFHDAEDLVRFTIGQFEIVPGARAVVPGSVKFSIDFRHPEIVVLDDLGDKVEPACRSRARACEVTIDELPRSAPVAFSGLVPDAIEAAVRLRGYPWRRIFSGALHDAGNLARLCPAGMVFVPCERGLSHNEAENAKPSDLAAGAQVIADVLVDLADRD